MNISELAQQQRLRNISSRGTAGAPPAQKRKRKKKEHRVHNHDLDPSCRETLWRGKLYGACILAEKVERARKLEKQRREAEERAANFKVMCKAAGLPLPVREYRFAWDAMRREWEADFCWVDERVALEVEGGAWSGGRHTRGSGYLEDMVKYNAMTVLGYKLLRCTPSTLCSDSTISLVKQALQLTEAA